jgi:hypothetical protein
MFEYNLFAVVAREIARLHRVDAQVKPHVAVLSRRAMRRSSPAVTLRDLYAKVRGRLLHLPGAISGRG